MINETDLEAMAPGFREWLYEVEVYSTRIEWLCNTFDFLDPQGWDDLLKWLYAAYIMGTRD